MDMLSNCRGNALVVVLAANANANSRIVVFIVAGVVVNGNIISVVLNGTPSSDVILDRENAGPNCPITESAIIGVIITIKLFISTTYLKAQTLC